MEENINDESKADTFNRIIHSYLDKTINEIILLPLLGSMFSNAIDFVDVRKTVTKEFQFFHPRLQQLDNLELFLKTQPERCESLRQKKKEISEKRTAFVNEYGRLKDELAEMMLSYQEEVNIVQNKLGTELDMQALQIKQHSDLVDIILPADVAPVWYKEDDS